MLERQQLWRAISALMVVMLHPVCSYWPKFFALFFRAMLLYRWMG